MVVVVIMAIMVSLAVLSIGVGGRDTQLDEESRRIEGLVTLLHERALLEGHDYGLRIEPAAYEFVIYDAERDRWLTMTDQGEFRRRTLPAGVSFVLELDSQVVVLKAPDQNFIDEAPPPPQVSIAASGEGTPFRLTLIREATHASAAVASDAFGKMTLTLSDHVEKPS